MTSLSTICIVFLAWTSYIWVYNWGFQSFFFFIYYFILFGKAFFFSFDYYLGFGCELECGRVSWDICGEHAFFFFSLPRSISISISIISLYTIYFF